MVCGALALIAPAVLWWSLPLTAGYLLAIPFAVITADPKFGRALKRFGICGIPEDFRPPEEIVAALLAPDVQPNLPVKGAPSTTVDRVPGEASPASS